jgi:hypothetical protein
VAASMGSIGWVDIRADGPISQLIICRWTRCHHRSPQTSLTVRPGGPADHARFWDRREVKFVRATRQSLPFVADFFATNSFSHVARAF